VWNPITLVAEGFDVALRAAQKLSDSSLVATKVGSTSFGLFAAESYLARRGTPRNAEEYSAPGGSLFVVTPATRHRPARVSLFCEFLIKSLRALPWIR